MQYQQYSFMKLLPNRTITLQTSLSKDECVATLTKNMFIRSPEAFILFEPNDVMFVGTLDGDSFKLRCVKRWAIFARKTFSPIVSGRFKSITAGTEIALKFRLHWFGIVFMSLWYLVVSAACLLFSAMYITEKDFPVVFPLVPYGMLLFAIMRTNYVFTAGYKIVRDELLQVFKCQEQI